ncbi:MAG: AAA family ATPase [Methylicorpusculum sp.]|uniref:AAA family ATPase n=1 Tax=Methylicorpusculum sp. TaxID=2713644 RepID=UPI00273156B0|nr:AAA family ATPase [Methylicorpusculum sp.]MDP2202288.1 AAA family ATPase [Methylicorpusculum sp.]
MSTYPEHYTPEDIQQIEQIKAWMADRNYKQAALARLARVSASSLSQILGGSYATPPGKLLTNVANAMKHADDTASDTVAAVETSVFRLALTACQMARRYRNFAVISAFVGTGKTFAVRHYQRTTPNTYLIEATPTMTVQSLVKQLARTVAGYEGKGSIDDKFQAVIASLNNTDSLLIIDEADTLTPHVLHTLRRLRDLANIGVVLCGTEHLTGLIRPAHGQFDQIRSRTGFWPETIKAITADDAAALVQAALGDEDVSDEVVKRLFAYSKGSARMLIEGLVAAITQFRNGRELTVGLVDAVAKQALCLQSVA